MGEAKSKVERLEARIDTLSQQVGRLESQVGMLGKAYAELAAVVGQMPNMELKQVAMARFQRDQLRGKAKVVGEGDEAVPDYDAYIEEALADQSAEAAQAEALKAAAVPEGPVEFGG